MARWGWKGGAAAAEHQGGGGTVRRNCWFCAGDVDVRAPRAAAPEQTPSWTCPRCGSYNGFTPDGDYDRPIGRCATSDGAPAAPAYADRGLFQAADVLCDTCNHHQRLIVALLASFEPTSEATELEEAQAFRKRLEERYPLCAACEAGVARHLAQQARSFQTTWIAAMLKSSKGAPPTPVVRWWHQPWRVLQSLCMLAVAIADLAALAGHVHELAVEHPALAACAAELNTTTTTAWALDTLLDPGRPCMLLHLAPVVVLVLLVLGVVATVPIGSQTPPSIARQPVLRPVRLGDRTRRRAPTVWTRLRLQRLGAELAVGVTRLALLWLTASSDLLLLPALAWRPASPRTWINVMHLAALHATALALYWGWMQREPGVASVRRAAPPARATATAVDDAPAAAAARVTDATESDGAQLLPPALERLGLDRPHLLPPPSLTPPRSRTPSPGLGTLSATTSAALAARSVWPPSALPSALPARPASRNGGSSSSSSPSLMPELRPSELERFRSLGVESDFSRIQIDPSPSRALVGMVRRWLGWLRRQVSAPQGSGGSTEVPNVFLGRAQRPKQPRARPTARLHGAARAVSLAVAAAVALLVDPAVALGVVLVVVAAACVSALTTAKPGPDVWTSLTASAVASALLWLPSPPPGSAAAVLALASLHAALLACTA